jgi:hypothetical protein
MTTLPLALPTPLREVAFRGEIADAKPFGRITTNLIEGSAAPSTYGASRISCLAEIYIICPFVNGNFANSSERGGFRSIAADFVQANRAVVTYRWISGLLELSRP